MFWSYRLLVGFGKFMDSFRIVSQVFHSNYPFLPTPIVITVAALTLAGWRPEGTA